MAPTTLRARLIALLAACLLALGLAACGGDDGDGEGPGGGDASADATGGDSSDGGDASAGDPAAEKRRAAQAIERLYAAMREMDAAGVCAELNQAARSEIAKGALAKRETGSCEKGFESFFRQAEEAGGLEAPFDAEVRRVELDGDRATAIVNFGPKQNGKVPLVKVDDDWKLEAAGAAR